MQEKKENFQIPFGVLKKTKDKFVNIEEKPSISFFINTGIYILDKKIIKKITKPVYLKMTDFLKKSKIKKLQKKIFCYMKIGLI